MSRSDELFSQLRSDPEGFREAGLAYQLLKEYFAGLPLETLRELISQSSNINTIRDGIWIASELGAKAAPLVDDALPLLNLNDRYVSYHVLDLLASCSSVLPPFTVLRIAGMIGCEDEVVGRRSAWLLSRLPEDVLRNALREEQEPAHRAGLAALLGEHTIEVLVFMASIGDIVVRRYAAAALKRRGLDVQTLTRLSKATINTEVIAILNR